MRQRYHRHFRYRLTRAPKALRKARLDKIAIVPASMLVGKKSLQETVNTLRRRQVLLCHTKENIKQKRILERAQEIFRRLGYAVRLLPMEQAV